MPKNRKSDDSDTSDSGPDDRPAKKTKVDKKPEKKVEAKGKSGKSKNDSDEPSWNIDKRRMVKVREFRGNVMVDIREYYEKDGDLLPGKKGISLSLTQWNNLKEIISEVDDVVQSK